MPMSELDNLYNLPTGTRAKVGKKKKRIIYDLDGVYGRRVPTIEPYGLSEIKRFQLSHRKRSKS